MMELPRRATLFARRSSHSAWHGFPWHLADRAAIFGGCPVNRYDWERIPRGFGLQAVAQKLHVQALRCESSSNRLRPGGESENARQRSDRAMRVTCQGAHIRPSKYRSRPRSLCIDAWIGNTLHRRYVRHARVRICLPESLWQFRMTDGTVAPEASAGTAGIHTCAVQMADRPNPPAPQRPGTVLR